MLQSLRDLEQYTLSATDGEVGKIVNCLFDEERWIVRYLVVEMAGSPDGRVLISPLSFRDVSWDAHRFELALSLGKLRHSPSADVDKRLSLHQTAAFNRYYGLPNHWEHQGLDVPQAQPVSAQLRSARELTGFGIQGTDEVIGHVADLIVDGESWNVRYLVVDTQNWWFGKKVLMAPQWATRSRWEERSLEMEISRQAITKSPQWARGGAINREYETRLYDFYGRPVYFWDGGERRSMKRPQHSVSR